MAPLDLSDLDPYHASPRIFSSRPQTPSDSAAPSASRPPPPPLPSEAVDDDPLSSFSSLTTSGSRLPSGSATPPVVKAHQARQEAVLKDLQRDPFTAPPESIFDESSLFDPSPDPSSSTISLASTSSPTAPVPIGTVGRRPSRTFRDPSTSFSPPRRLSLLMTDTSISPPLNRASSFISHPTLADFHPSSPPPHSAEFSVRRTASHSGIHPPHHQHHISPGSTPEEDMWSDFQSGSVPHASDPLKMAWAAKGVRAATLPAKPVKKKEEPLKVEGTEPWKKEWSYDEMGADAVHPIKLVGVRAGVRRAMDEDIAEGIRPNLPPRHRIATKWTLLYSLDQHGISISTMYERMKAGLQGGDNGVVLVVKDGDGSIFGAYVNEGLRESKTYYGDGSCFLWKSTPFPASDFRVGSSVRAFKWTGKNTYLVLSESNYLSVGGGDGKFGLWVDGKFEKGFSARCPAFDNDPLPLEKRWEKAPGGVGDEAKFEVVGFEVWAVGV